MLWPMGRINWGGSRCVENVVVGQFVRARSISGVMELSSAAPRRMRSMAQIRVGLTPMNDRRPIIVRTPMG